MEQLIKYIENPESGRANFEMAKFYLEQKHYAGAISHFLRTAEWGDWNEDKNIIYESLIQMAVCLGALGNRQYSEEGWLLQAIAFQPNRPEAYWLHSLYHERKNLWIEAYTDAVLGLQYKDNARPMEVNIGYEGEYVLVFQRMVSAWWTGRTNESRELLFTLPDKYNLSPKYMQHVQNNMSRIGLLDQKNSFFTYTSNDLHRYRFPFEGIKNIERNHSQIYQDMFVLSVLNGKQDGFYLEIGSGDPFIGNNTALLEQLGWRGVSIDIKEESVKKFALQRKNKAYCKDAACTNFKALLTAENAPQTIDYLQVDCEPAQTTYDALLNIPFEQYKFAVITFEHDHYNDLSRKVKEKSRKYLESFGYRLLVSEVGFNGLYSFEDWWVHPDLVNVETIDKMDFVTTQPQKIQNYMLRYMDIDWGLLGKNTDFAANLYDEVFVKDMYQKFFEVEEGDVVVDIGASVGPFPIKIEEKKPQMIYCFEPHKGCYKTLTANVEHMENVLCFNRAIANVDEEITVDWMNLDSLKAESNTVMGIRFDTFIQNWGIDTIDFLKMDCEGGEYAVFTEENLPWIKANVKKMAIEFHSWGDLKEQFRQFRDTYLPHFKTYWVTSFDGIDIKAGLWEENFLNYWNYFYVYIDNR